MKQANQKLKDDKAREAFLVETGGSDSKELGEVVAPEVSTSTPKQSERSERSSQQEEEGQQ